MSHQAEPAPVVALGTKTARDALAARGLALASHPPGTALAQLADLIRETAGNVDEVQQKLLQRADMAIRQLQSVTLGRDRYRHGTTDGLLQSLGNEIDTLVARRGEGVQLLRMLTNSYADLQGAPKPQPAAPSHRPAPRRSGR
ncbi:hypothetical protein BJP40_03935 [Streptomyces sp. CC53]|uniref:hypothetical protein n=1 Tax=Streptomyces sp. CC53 TaxID=1906740 RepID=UPI0008DCF420|nr:hypothetical protein [Streptomyces sp. CC53]OII62159.1 hypothetical protein BJP40_03935 [Streptomyces sp. CC53]